MLCMLRMEVEEMKKMNLCPLEMSDFTHDLFTGLYASVTFYKEDLEMFKDAAWDVKDM